MPPTESVMGGDNGKKNMETVINRSEKKCKMKILSKNKTRNRNNASAQQTTCYHGG